MTTTLPKLEDIEYARQIAWTAVDKDPSEDLCIDDQESLAHTFLALSDFVTQLHAWAVDDDVRAADFFQNVTAYLDGSGIKQGWTGYAPFKDDDEKDDDSPPYHQTDGETVWTCAEEAAANRDGWCICEPAGADDMGLRDGLEIQFDSDHRQFASDDDAWKHVLAKANEGSDLHRRAVLAVHTSNDEPGSCLREYARDNDIPWPLDEATDTTETNPT